MQAYPPKTQFGPALWNLIGCVLFQNFNQGPIFNDLGQLQIYLNFLLYRFSVSIMPKDASGFTRSACL